LADVSDGETGELYAINLDPDHWGRGLGRALLGEGRGDEAVLVLEQAIAGFRDTPLTTKLQWAESVHIDARKGLAEVLMTRGHVTRARELLEDVLRADEARLAKEDGGWLSREALATTLMTLGGTYSATDPTEAVRRAGLLDRAAAILDSPDAEGRITMEGKATKAQVAALRTGGETTRVSARE
jgi:hypothetical protein